jgi:hypothetical protein
MEIPAAEIKPLLPEEDSLRMKQTGLQMTEFLSVV